MSTRRLLWQPASGLARRTRSRKSIAEMDQDRIERAVQIQVIHRDWLVMWSPWHRTFTAFGCFPDKRLVLDDETADGLIAKMHNAEAHYAPTRIDFVKGIPVDVP